MAIDTVRKNLVLWRLMIVFAVLVMITLVFWSIDDPSVGSAPNPTIEKSSAPRLGIDDVSDVVNFASARNESFRQQTSSAVSENVDATSSSGGTLRVIVSFQDGSAAPGLGVTIYQLDREDGRDKEEIAFGKPSPKFRAMTDLLGAARFESLLPGNYSITTDRNYASMGRVLVPAVGTVETRITLSGRNFSVQVVDDIVQPIEGASVYLIDHLVDFSSQLHIEIGRTDGRGRLAIKAAPPGCGVIAMADGFEPSEIYVIRASSSIDLVKIRVDKESGTLKGTVYDYAGTPISGVRLGVHRQGSSKANTYYKDGLSTRPNNSLQTITDEQGGFVLRSCFADELTIVTGRTDSNVNAPWRGRVSVRPNQTSILNITLPRAARCSGVISNENGDFVEGVRVDARSGLHGRVARSWSDNEGRYLLSGLPSGDIELKAIAVDGSSAIKHIVVRPDDLVRANIVLSGENALRGVVLDPEQVAVSGLLIIASSGTWARNTLTNSEGRFSFSDTPQKGLLTLIAQRNGAYLYNVDYPLPISGDIDIVVEPGYFGTVLRGKVVDSSGTALGHAKLIPMRVGAVTGRIYRLSMGASTFELEKLMEGDYLMKVTAGGYEPLDVSFSITRDRATDLGEIVMTEWLSDAKDN